MTVVTGLILQLCGFLATNNKIFPVLACGITCGCFWPRIVSSVRGRKNRDVGLILDEMIMTMRSGVSFERSLRAVISTKGEWANFSRSLEDNGKPSPRMTNGQTSEEEKLLALLRFCKENVSQSFKLLCSFRDSYRLRAKLERRHKIGSMQAVGQAWVSAVIYVAIFIFQWNTVPGFQSFLLSMWGRVVFILSALLLAGGLCVIRGMAKPRNLEV